MGLSWSSLKSPQSTKMKARTTSSVYKSDLGYHNESIVRNLVPCVKIHPALKLVVVPE